MHCILCTVSSALYSIHCIISIVFYCVYSMHCVLCMLIKPCNSLQSERRLDHLTDGHCQVLSLLLCWYHEKTKSTPRMGINNVRMRADKKKLDQRGYTREENMLVIILIYRISHNSYPCLFWLVKRRIKRL